MRRIALVLVLLPFSATAQESRLYYDGSTLYRIPRYGTIESRDYRGETDIPKRRNRYHWEDKRMRPLDYPSRSGNSRWLWRYGTTVERE